MRLPSVIALTAAAISVPASACLAVTPAVRGWVQCGYVVAHASDDHRFMVSMARAKVFDKKLKPTSEARWREIESRIEQECGSFAEAQRADAGKDEGSSYIPEDQFMAIYDTSDRDKLVES